MMRPTAHRDDDEALLAAMVGGDERAFETFYRRHLGSVTGFHLRRTGRPEVAFDLTAETFAAVVEGCDRFDPERGSALGWLYAIAANKLRDSLRRGRVQDEARRRLGHERIALDDHDLERVDELARGEDELGLLARLSALPEDQRTAIVARVLDERDYAEIAATLACSEAVVRQRVRRGLRRLRLQLEETT